MDSKPSSKKSSAAARRHAQWVREHPRIEASPFPSYPDEPSRRGASRGALPNGNPWRSELEEPDSSPWSRPRDFRMPVLSPSAPDAEPRVVHAPPSEPAPVATIAPNLDQSGRRMASDIEKWLSNSTMLEGSEIEIDVRGSTAILHGRVATLDARREAEMIASSVRGVAEVVNRISVARRLPPS